MLKTDESFCLNGDIRQFLLRYRSHLDCTDGRLWQRLNHGFQSRNVDSNTTLISRSISPPRGCIVFGSRHCLSRKTPAGCSARIGGQYLGAVEVFGILVARFITVLGRSRRQFASLFQCNTGLIRDMTLLGVHFVLISLALLLYNVGIAKHKGAEHNQTI